MGAWTWPLARSDEESVAETVVVCSSNGVTLTPLKKGVTITFTSRTGSTFTIVKTFKQVLLAKFDSSRPENMLVIKLHPRVQCAKPTSATTTTISATPDHAALGLSSSLLILLCIRCRRSFHLLVGSLQSLVRQQQGPAGNLEIRGKGAVRLRLLWGTVGRCLSIETSSSPRITQNIGADIT